MRGSMDEWPRDPAHNASVLINHTLREHLVPSAQQNDAGGHPGSLASVQGVHKAGQIGHSL